MPNAILTTLFLVLVSGCLCSMHRLLHKSLRIVTDNTTHMKAQNLTRLTIAALVTQLHNGKKFKPYTLDKAMQILAHCLTDVLLVNGYNLRDWNPLYLIQAELANSGLLQDLETILEKRRTEEECQEPSTGPPSTDT